MDVKILHIYPQLMNLYGEYANVRLLERLLTQAGANVVTHRAEAGEPLAFSEYDLIYMGCGTESASCKVLECLLPYRDALKDYIESGKLLIATGNAFELLGARIRDDTWGEYGGLGLFPFQVERTHQKRFLGDAILTFSQEPHKVMGFVNKCSAIRGVDAPLFQAELGLGNDNETAGEGLGYKNVFATSLIGPLFIRNPYFCRYVLGRLYDALSFQPEKEPDMSLLLQAYDAALAELTASQGKR